MKRKLVIANWKMNGDITANYNLLKSIINLPEQAQGVDIVICPPFVYLSQTKEIIEGKNLKLGAQNVCAESVGAYTGEVSIDMLSQFGCEYVLVGHSERRSHYKESDLEIAKKIMLIVNAKKTPVLCIGETLTQRADNETQTIILMQLKAILDIVGLNYFKAIVIAYEPIWAIGTGQTATAEQAQEIHSFIRDYLKEIDTKLAQNINILYGGSVNETNAKNLISQPDIDGFLVGSASLKQQSFTQICMAGMHKTKALV